VKEQTTARGFKFYQFKDHYGVSCSLQKSSLATEACVWLGCDEPNARVLVPGKSWQPVVLPEGTLCDTRMHLTQKQVKALLPRLTRFAKTGAI
jgi:hypothetical protein